jgi:hypothetical protein
MTRRLFNSKHLRIMQGLFQVMTTMANIKVVIRMNWIRRINTNKKMTRTIHNII